MLAGTASKDYPDTLYTGKQGDKMPTHRSYSGALLLSCRIKINTVIKQHHAIQSQCYSEDILLPVSYRDISKFHNVCGSSHSDFKVLSFQSFHVRFGHFQCSPTTITESAPGGSGRGPPLPTQALPQPQPSGPSTTLPEHGRLGLGPGPGVCRA